MTLSAKSKKLKTPYPSKDEQEAAIALRRAIASHQLDKSPLKLQEIRDGETVETEVVLSNGLSQILLDLLRHVSAGEAVTLVPLSQKLTTQQSADILNVSRPYLVKLLEEGKIPFELVGRHRRIQSEDLFNYKESRDNERRSALESLAKLDGELL